MKSIVLALVALTLPVCAVSGESLFNRKTFGYEVNVKMTWANHEKTVGECTPCPYTCVLPKAKSSSVSGSLSDGSDGSSSSSGDGVTLPVVGSKVPSTAEPTNATTPILTTVPKTTAARPISTSALPTTAAATTIAARMLADANTTDIPTTVASGPTTDASTDTAETNSTISPTPQKGFQPPTGDVKGIKPANVDGDTSVSGVAAAPYFSSFLMKGCCFAEEKKLYVAGQPSCSATANPPEAEDCGFRTGPTIVYKVPELAQKTPKAAVLFASTDCENFWSVSRYPYSLRTSGNTTTDGYYPVEVAQGCFGSSLGSSMALVGCILNSTDFSPKTWLKKTWTYKELASSCLAVGGKCGRTNNVYTQNLECCASFKTDALKDVDDFDINYKKYLSGNQSSFEFNGGIIVAIVFGSAALMICGVITFVRIRRRAKEMAALRELEASEDYEEIITPLTAGDVDVAEAGARKVQTRSIMSTYDGDIDIDHDILLDKSKEKEEVLYEGDL